MMKAVKIIRIKGNERETVEDWVAEEIPLTINALDKELATLLSSPVNLDDLVRGFLFASGLINEANQIERIDFDEKCWVADVHLNASVSEKNILFKRLYTSGCGGGVLLQNVLESEPHLKVSSNIKLETDNILAMMRDFQKKSELFSKTGGSHSAALADDREMLIFREDIGRHNAVDKVIGQALLKQVSFKDKILLSSGRLSTEIIFKALKCQIPVVISKSAPTSKAVKLAQEFGLTLVGFARGHKLNIYAGKDRIK